MELSREHLRPVITEAITHQLTESGGKSSPDNEVLVKEAAERLLDEAIASGRIKGANVADLRSFSAGNSSMMVARMVTDLSFVVKIDENPAVVNEADILRRAGEDTSLPEATRQAFPRIYAIDRVGPIYGYLMEDLSMCAPLHEVLATGDQQLNQNLLCELWRSLLEPAYRATRSERLIPNVAEDYFARAGRRLASAAADGLLPRPEDYLVFVDQTGDRFESQGWGAELRWATTALARVAPPFGTFVHGDPNPENVLVDRRFGDATFRLLDPKNWWVGDYLFDVAKLMHYTRITGPAEHADLRVLRSVTDRECLIEYDRTILNNNGVLEDEFLNVISAFAESPTVNDSPDWRIRYRLAVAANLIGITGPRIQKGQESIALIALGEGLRELRVAASMLQAARA